MPPPQPPTRRRICDRSNWNGRLRLLMPDWRDMWRLWRRRPKFIRGERRRLPKKPRSNPPPPKPPPSYYSWSEYEHTGVQCLNIVSIMYMVIAIVLLK